MQCRVISALGCLTVIALGWGLLTLGDNSDVRRRGRTPLSAGPGVVDGAESWAKRASDPLPFSSSPLGVNQGGSIVLRPGAQAPHQDVLAARRARVVDALSVPQNIFFSQEQRTQEILRLGGVKDLERLLDESIEQDIGEGDAVYRDAVNIRMAAIDALEYVARYPAAMEMERQEATQALSALVIRAVEPELSLAARRTLIAEKHDALAALVRVAPVEGITLYRQFSVGKQREFMGHALLLALVDLGVPRGEAQQYLTELEKIN